MTYSIYFSDGNVLNITSSYKTGFQHLFFVDFYWHKVVNVQCGRRILRERYVYSDTSRKGYLGNKTTPIIKSHCDL